MFQTVRGCCKHRLKCNPALQQPLCNIAYLSVLLFRRHLLNRRQSLRHRRERDHDHGNDTFCQNVGVIVNDRIQGGKGLREILRHVVHPVQVAAQGVERAADQDAQDVALHQAVLGLHERAGQAEAREGQYVVAADLEQGQHVRLLKELQDSVGKARHDAGSDAVPVADQADEEHREQRHRPAVGQGEDLDEGCDEGQRHGGRAEGQLLRAHLFLRSGFLVKKSCGDDEKHRADAAQGVAEGRKTAVGCNNRHKNTSFACTGGDYGWSMFCFLPPALSGSSNEGPARAALSLVGSPSMSDMFDLKRGSGPHSCFYTSKTPVTPCLYHERKYSAERRKCQARISRIYETVWITK